MVGVLGVEGEEYVGRPIEVCGGEKDRLGVPRSLQLPSRMAGKSGSLPLSYGNR